MHITDKCKYIRVVNICLHSTDFFLYTYNKLVKVLQEMAEQNPKLVLNTKGKNEQTFLTNNKMTDDKLSEQLFPKQVAT